MNMSKKYYLFNVLNLVTMVIFSEADYVSASMLQEHFKYMNRDQYSYATTLAPVAPISLLGCAFKCNRSDSCDGFYYGHLEKKCVMGSRFLNRLTTAVDLLKSDIKMYLKKSYELPTQCPTNGGFHTVTVGDKTYCLMKKDMDRTYFDAQDFCRSQGGSLLYLGGDVTGNHMEQILADLGVGWNSGWRGTHQLSDPDGNTKWIWSYSGTPMTNQESNGLQLPLTWFDTSCSPCQKCMLFRKNGPTPMFIQPCNVTDDFICEVVLF